MTAKKKVIAVLCYLFGIITSGILIAICTAMTVHWTIALFFLTGWYYAFLIMPLVTEEKETKTLRKHLPVRDYKLNYKEKNKMR